MAGKTNGKDTAETLRRDLDAGRGRDKIAASDPAAAPLGTDDEAAGNPISAQQARSARSEEIYTTGAPTDVPSAMTRAADPDKAAPVHQTDLFHADTPPSEPAVSARLVRWGVGVLVAALVLWVLVRTFG